MLATILKGFFLATIVMPITGCGVSSGDSESDSDVSADDPREKEREFDGRRGEGMHPRFIRDGGAHCDQYLERMMRKDRLRLLDFVS